MHTAAIAYGLDKIADFVDAFNDQEPQLTPSDKFMLEVADAATDKLHTRIPDLVKKYAGKAEHFNISAALVPQIGKNLRRLIPSASVNSISAIVNAAWELRLNIDDWQILNAIADEASRKTEKLRVLRDLVLKSFEVYEFNKRTDKNA